MLSVHLPIDDNYNHLLTIYLPMIHDYFDKNDLFGKNFPIYSDVNHDVLSKYSKNILPLKEKPNDSFEIKYCSKTLTNELHIRVRDFLMKNIENDGNKKNIFIKRKNRIISNFEKIIETFKKINIELDEVDFSEMSFDDQIKLSIDTNLMVGVHGAGLSNLMFMNNNSMIIEIDPFDWGFNCYENLAFIFNIKKYMRFCDCKSKNKFIDNFELDIFNFEKKLVEWNKYVNI